MAKVKWKKVDSSLNFTYVLKVSHNNPWLIWEMIKVSGFLKDALGDAYMPPTHWTSHLRSRAGHKPYDSTDSSTSTFTIRDTNGRLKTFLSRKGYQQVKFLTESPTFHIHVVVPEGSAHSTFDIGSEQIKKVSKALDATIG